MEELHGWTLEQKRLFGPAFIAYMLFSACKGYASTSGGKETPLSLSFAVVSMALTPATVASLPSRTTYSFRRWVRENPQVVMQLEDRRVDLLPFMLRGTRLGLSTGVINGAPYALTKGSFRRPTGIPKFDSAELSTVARWLGAWLGKQDLAESEILALLRMGV